MTKSKSRVRLKLQFSGTTLGPGKVALLEKVASEGSISGAARVSGMGYRRAWHLLHTLQEGLKEPLFVTEMGGKAKGGAALTDFGKSLIKLYRDAEAETTRNSQTLLELLNSHSEDTPSESHHSES